MEKGIAGPTGRIRAARPLLAAGVTLLLALGAVSLTSARGSAIHAGGLLDHLWLLFAFLACVGAVGTAYQLLLRRDGAERASEAATRFNRAATIVFALLAVALPAAFYLARPTPADGSGYTCPTDCAVPMPTKKVEATHRTQLGHVVNGNRNGGIDLGPLLRIAGAVLGLLILAFMIFILVRAIRNAMRRLNDAQPINGLTLPDREIVDEAELERAMLAGRRALEGEARAAIIGCYAAMEESLSAAGVPLLRSDSPADLLARAAAGGLIEGSAPGRLAALFREARFSRHEMNADQLGNARTALDEIVGQLAARQQAAAKRAAEAAARVAAAQAARDAQAAAVAAPSRHGRAGKRA